MKNNDLKERTHRFALNMIKLVESLPKTTVAQVLGKQVLRSGTSVGANYRSANRAKSTADFIAKMSIVEEEADESAYWMNLLTDAKIIPENQVQELTVEANELVAIAVASIRTARARKQS